MEKINVKAIRESLNLNREEFAALVPVDPVTVWRWENGSSPHPVIQARIRQIAETKKRGRK